MSLKNIYHQLTGEKTTTGIPADLAPFTMTSPERLFSLVEAVKYIHRYGIAGDVVECGVGKGGSMLAAAEVLDFLNDTKRSLHLYDTLFV
jgi:hypothetical protein